MRRRTWANVIDFGMLRRMDFLSFRTRFLMALYTLGFTLCIPAILLRLLWRSRRLPAYRKRWLERFGFFKPPLKKGGLWVHAVSVGESVAAVPIIKAFQKQYPDLPIVVTTTTPTGSAQVQSTFGKQVFHVYFPYDLPGCIKRFLKRTQPKVCVIMETELWPNCLVICKKRKIPVIIANGRLSPSSMRGYRRLGVIIQDILKCVYKVAAQSKMDGIRFVDLGLTAKQLVMAGNVKFDVAVPADLINGAHTCRAELGTSRAIWIAASTHAGEEELILEAFKEIKKIINNALLILVPRHPDRFSSVGSLIQQQGFSMISRSSGLPVFDETAVYLGDTMGELMLLYAASDVAFIGGSFVPVGGHNMLEAAVSGVPVLVGPYIHNFIDISRLLIEAGAMTQISTQRELIEIIVLWLQNPEIRKRMGSKGKEVVEQNKGAVEKIMRIISDVNFQ